MTQTQTQSTEFAGGRLAAICEVLTLIDKEAQRLNGSPANELAAIALGVLAEKVCRLANPENDQ